MMHSSATRVRKKFASRPVLFGIGIAACLGILVVAAMLLRGLPPVADFIARYPGESPRFEDPEAGAEGFPSWVTWQHFLNFFMLAMIIRTGIASRSEGRPIGYWAPRGRSRGQKIRLIVFAHVSLDLLWMLNGVIYVALLFISGRWVRIIPTSWEVIPSTFSVAIQYASLNWPTESSWTYYNSLQQLTYFAVIFLLAPASALTGWRLSALWPQRWENFVPKERARALHFPLMIAFVVFVLGHVLLVLLTGALRNLNHMFAGIDSADSWRGAIMFAILAIVTAACSWVVSKPIVLKTWGNLTGSVSR